MGFIIGIATFILTRVGRKKSVIVEVYMGDYLELSDTSKDEVISSSTKLIKIRLTNIGGKPVIVNPESFLSKALGENQC